jgi:S1-C subfamily serine protease
MACLTILRAPRCCEVESFQVSAARAGILKGDFIFAINGTPVAKLTVLQMGTAIAKPAAAIGMTIQRGSETREVAIR